MQGLGWLTGSRLIQNQWRGWRQHFTYLRSKKPVVDDFAAMVKTFDLTTAQLRLQYQRRRVIAHILIILWLIFTLAPWRLNFVASLLLLMLYIQHSLRLYQLRQGNLCSLKAYGQAIWANWREALPLSLPTNWGVEG